MQAKIRFWMIVFYVWHCDDWRKREGTSLEDSLFYKLATQEDVQTWRCLERILHSVNVNEANAFYRTPWRALSRRELRKHCLSKWEGKKCTSLNARHLGGQNRRIFAEFTRVDAQWKKDKRPMSKRNMLLDIRGLANIPEQAFEEPAGNLIKKETRYGTLPLRNFVAFSASCESGNPSSGQRHLSVIASTSAVPCTRQCGEHIWRVFVAAEYALYYQHREELHHPCL